jgi:phospholipase C
MFTAVRTMLRRVPLVVSQLPVMLTRVPLVFLRRPRRALLAIPLILAAGAASIPTAGGAPPPIEHVVVILQENHSFDNVLGQLCIQDKRENCSAAASGENEKGETIPLSKAADVVVQVSHDQKSQLNAMHKGKMNGWERVGGCQLNQCYTAYEPSQIPSLAAMARAGTISDHFFSRDIVPSWGAHLDFFAQTLDGFVGNNPTHLKSAPPAGPGWGCDSNLDAEWIEPVSKKKVKEPSCIPNLKGEGPYRKSPVPYVPTIADRIEEAGKTWGIYGAVNPKIKGEEGPYKWATCPTFAECLLGAQKSHLHDDEEFKAEAEAGTLPGFSLLTPNDGVSGQTSQHNGTSMMVGDNHIGEEVSAIQKGPDGSTTTIFIYYDDCGCFYDHLAPPKGLGIRAPLVIVSPYAKKGFTDNKVATNSSILAYTETVLHVKAVTKEDEEAYNFKESFSPEPSAARFAFHAAPVPPSSRNLPPPPANEDT